MAPTTANNPSGKRFELPALNFNFSSLTEGTSIPPPPDSPVEEKVPTPPKTPVAAEKKEAKVAAANGSPSKPTTTTTAGTKRRADDAPLSPASTSSRAGSLRRLFSRNLLNNAYAEGESQSIANGSGGTPAPSVRPASRSNGSIFDEKKAKRGSGFFRRLRTNDRSGSLYQHSNGSQTTSKPEPRGPPPPMIPELSALESKLDVNDGGSLGDDLFKNIK